jgi:tRNA-dihydrouridine synthase
VLFARANGADLTYTEFISSEGLLKGTASSRRKLDIFAGSGR